jgi:hypothetical protein
MKKILLLMMCCPAMLAAQNGNGVTVSNLNVASGTVTFNVSWKKADMPTLWSDSVWVFVDYNNAGKMERLLLSGATLSAPSWSAATVIFGKDGNKQGAWVVGNARSAGSFSATVKLLTATADLAGVCAYASNYPPVGEYETPTQIKFTGTPMYNIVLMHESGGTITRRSDSPFSVPASYTVQSFTDATGAPGNFILISPICAASTQTWTLASLTWSDRIVATPSGCTVTTSVPNDVPSPAQYVVRNNNYYYTSTCMFISQNTLCPKPWRMPVYSDLVQLIDEVNPGTLYSLWGVVGYIHGSGMPYPHHEEIWSITPVPDVTGGYYYMHRGSDFAVTGTYVGPRAYIVRCVY